MPSWGTKKRRTTRYKRVGNKGRRGNLSITTRTTAPRSVKTKTLTKSKRAAYRRALWNSTITETKNKSVLATSTTITTPPNTVSQTVGFATIFNETTPFWLVTGGNQSNTFGVAAGDNVRATYVIRGGKFYWIITCNPASADNVSLRYQLIYPKQQSRNSTDTAFGTPISDWTTAFVAATHPIGSTAQEFPDYKEYFHLPILDKEVILRPGEACKEERRIKITKIDHDEFQRGGGKFPYLFIYVHGTTDATADTIRLTWGHSLSYVGQ